MSSPDHSVVTCVTRRPKKKKVCSYYSHFENLYHLVFNTINSQDLKVNENHTIRYFVQRKRYFTLQKISVTCVTRRGQGF